MQLLEPKDRQPNIVIYFNKSLKTQAPQICASNKAKVNIEKKEVLIRKSYRWALIGRLQTSNCAFLICFF